MKKGWEKRTFGEVLDVLRNGVNCKQDKKGVGEKISRIESISSGEFDTERVGYTFLTEAEKNKYKLEYGDILFSHINSPIHVGKTAIFKSDYEIFHGVNLLLMRPKPFLDKAYFEHYLKYLYQNGYWKGLCKQSVNQASVNQQDINKVEITFPESLPEQQHIVSILDKAFAAIARAKTHAEQNLKNAKELFESYLQGVFEKKGDGWEEKKLGEVCEIRPPKKEAREKLKDYDLVSFLPMEDLGVCENDIKPVKEKPLKDVTGSYTYFAENDVLLAKITPCFENGKLGIAKNLTNGIGFGSSEYIVFRCSEDVTPEFLFYFLSRVNMREEGKKYMGGAVGQKRVSKDWIENYLLSYPNSLKEQQTIVNQLYTLRAETQKLEAVYKKKIDDLEELKKSILAKAFAGELKTEKAEMIKT